MKFATHRHEERRCPVCGKAVNAATGVDHNHSPAPGDVTMCIECAHILFFDERLTLRQPTSAERAALEASQDWPLIKRTQEAIRTSSSLREVLRQKL